MHKRIRSVQFEQVQIREFERIIGDNPSCSSGAPIGIGWAHSATDRIYHVDDYEAARPYRRFNLDLVLTRQQREKILVEWGAGVSDIVDAIRSTIRAKNQRRRTINTFNRYAKWEEVMESAGRKFRRTLSLKGGASAENLCKQFHPRTQQQPHGDATAGAVSPDEQSSIRVESEARLGAPHSQKASHEQLHHELERKETATQNATSAIQDKDPQATSLDESPRTTQEEQTDDADNTGANDSASVAAAIREGVGAVSQKNNEGKSAVSTQPPLDVETGCTSTQCVADEYKSSSICSDKDYPYRSHYVTPPPSGLVIINDQTSADKAGSIRNHWILHHNQHYGTPSSAPAPAPPGMVLAIQRYIEQYGGQQFRHSPGFPPQTQHVVPRLKAPFIQYPLQQQDPVLATAQLHRHPGQHDFQYPQPGPAPVFSPHHPEDCPFVPFRGYDDQQNLLQQGLSGEESPEQHQDDCSIPSRVSLYYEDSFSDLLYGEDDITCSVADSCGDEEVSDDNNRKDRLEPVNGNANLCGELQPGHVYNAQVLAPDPARMVFSEYGAMNRFDGKAGSLQYQPCRYDGGQTQVQWGNRFTMPPPPHPHTTLQGCCQE